MIVFAPSETKTDLHLPSEAPKITVFTQVSENETNRIESVGSKTNFAHQ